MSNNQDLIDQFALCEQWQDADQWDALGMLYFQRGYVLNAGVCFQRADACRLQARLRRNQRARRLWKKGRSGECAGVSMSALNRGRGAG